MVYLKISTISIKQLKMRDWKIKIFSFKNKIKTLCTWRFEFTTLNNSGQIILNYEIELMSFRKFLLTVNKLWRHWQTSIFIPIDNNGELHQNYSRILEYEWMDLLDEISKFKLSAFKLTIRSISLLISELSTIIN